jgi:hypothetical protein
MTKNPIITEKEWIAGQFTEIKNSISELRDILLGKDGEVGIAHRVKYAENQIEKIKLEIDKREKKIIGLIISLVLGGSFVWIKESRDFIVSIIKTLFL